MATYLITGGAGFIGTNLVKMLLSEGHAVRVVDNYAAGKKPERILAGGRGVDGIFHLAAVPRVTYSVEHPAEAHDNNVNGTLNVLLCARDAGVKRVVFSSSSAVWGDQPSYPVPEAAVPRPLSPYGLQKLVGEHYCRLFADLYGLETVVLRYFNIYGSYMDPEGAYALVIGKFLKQKREGIPLTICGDGEYYRDYTHVSDAARSNVLAMLSPRVGRGEVIEIGCGAPHSTNQVAGLVGGPSNHIEPRPGDMRYAMADVAKAKQLLNWEPKIDLATGISLLKAEWGVE